MWIDTFTKQAAILGKNLGPEGSKDQLRVFFTSDNFLRQFIKPFREIFSEDEISSLLVMYQSPVMKKMLKHAKELFDPLYLIMGKHVEQISI